MAIPIPPDGQPWPFAWPPSEHCYIHQAHEPRPASGAYMICFECGHVYLSDEELVNAFITNAPPGHRSFPVPEHITFCPLCLHDF